MEETLKGLIVTSGKFTADAIDFADGHSGLELINGNRLRELSRQYLDFEPVSI